MIKNLGSILDSEVEHGGEAGILSCQPYRRDLTAGHTTYRSTASVLRGTLFSAAKNTNMDIHPRNEHYDSKPTTKEHGRAISLAECKNSP